ncbi:MAG: VCBS repeat-containing protein [Planctomycetota bacterium]|nr:VCBS repeat-containing protein [Planctomycetota bacterium]
MRLALVPLLGALVLGLTLPGTHVQAEPTTVTLEGAATVQGLQRADVDGDGIVDLLLLSGRTVRVWRGARGALPTAGPTWTWEAPATTSFLAAAAPGAHPTPGTPTLLAIGRDDARLVRLDGSAGADMTPHTTSGLGWSDDTRASFADLLRPGGTLLPTSDGWRLEGKDAIALRLGRHHDVKAPGPFLEDTCNVTAALPEVFLGAPATAGAQGLALWAIADRKLISQASAARVEYDLGFLGAGDAGDFDQTLVDLDGDRRPEVLHRIFTNRQVHYGFFRTRPATDATGPTHKPADCTISLQGFQLDPDLVDVNGDGRPDLVITSMQINAANMLAALTSGKVIAETRAFLNRGKSPYFLELPDATVSSEIGVKVQFNYAGNVEVVRALTIVLDGDYDGDGRKDLLIRTGSSVLTIHPGTEAGVWAGADAARTVTIDPPADSTGLEAYAADLDADGRDELVLVFRGPTDLVRIVKP